jgi:hypothetical protein
VNGFLKTISNAYDQPARPKGTEKSDGEVKITSTRELPATPWGVRAGDDPYAEEAKLGFA